MEQMPRNEMHDRRTLWKLVQYGNYIT